LSVAFDRFDVYFSGKLLTDRPEQDVREAVARLFKADAARVAMLFSGKPVRIRRGVDAETAGRYRASLRAAGALVDIRPNNDPAPPSTGTNRPVEDVPPVAGVEVSEDGPEFELLPPRTGSLADIAPPSPPPLRPDLSGLDLAQPGAPLDDTPPPPPARIPTDHLSAGAPNAGSLEDCVVIKPARQLPDISHLRIDED
jgi:hypothetical protein